jgi:NosR/NirI family nitrous oxide reductase transcriptional regulator
MLPTADVAADHLAKGSGLKNLLVSLILLLGAAAPGAEEFAFPPPDLGEDYIFPQSSQAPARLGAMAWLDMAALLVALGTATFLVHRRRSRTALAWLSVASLAYFGFYREGCVCPIGSIQNIAQALFDPGYVVPFVVLFFFFLPLIFAVVFGRVFCGAVCPLGAIQDVVLLKGLRIPRWLEEGLGLLRYFYLGLAVLLAATQTTYLICQYDPFVGFFRLSARFHIWIYSGAFLVLSTFIGRPYCRFLCPYGALLGIVSRFSMRRVTITPDRCIACGLCTEACAFGAIHESSRKEDGDGE